MDPAFLPETPPAFALGEHVLRELRAADAAAWHAVLADPEVVAHTSYDIRGPAQVEEMVSHLRAAVAAGTGMRFALARRSDDVLVGTCGFLSFEAADGRAEIGYDLARALWGRGLMRAAAERVLRHAFDDLGVHRVQATVMTGNARSERLLAGLGFRREGLLRGYKRCRGVHRDFAMFARLRSDPPEET